MAAQNALLDTTVALDRLGSGISLTMVDFLNNVKSQPLGFRQLGLDFLGICEIVNSLKSSLQQHFETNQPFPERAVPELSRILQKAYQDFGSLDQLLKKFMEYEKGGAFATLQKTWRLFFADKDIAKIHMSLQENKGALNMTMLLTNIKANEASTSVGHEYELLAARLQQTPDGSAKAPDAKSSFQPSVLPPTIPPAHSDNNPIPSVSGLAIDDHSVPPPQYQEHPDLPNPASNVSTLTDQGASSREIPFAQSTAEPLAAIAEPALATTRPARVPVRIDRASIVKRTPQSNIGASSVALKNTLIAAVEGGKERVVEQLLNRGVPPDTGPEKNAVHIAVGRRDTPTLKLLLDFGASPDSLDSRGHTPFESACYTKDDIAKMLLEYGADPNLAAPEWVPLPHALYKANIDIVTFLLQCGADPNGMSKNGQSNMVYAAERPQENLIQELIDWGGDTNTPNQKAMTPLVAACEHRRWEVVKVLLANGADPNLSEQTWAPLPWVIHSGDEGMVRYMLEHGADPNACSKNGESNMVYAAKKPHEKIMQALIEHGGDPNRATTSGMTPLAAACEHRQFEIAKILIANGADPNLSAQTWAPLPWVMNAGDEGMVRYMIEHGADPNACSKNGESNMIYAAKKPHEKIMQLLIEHGGNVNAKSPEGNTPLLLASEHRHFGVAKVLLSHGADPNLSASDWAPLPWVINSGDESAVRLFLDHNADPNGVSGNGQLNIIYAAGKPHPKIMQTLIDRGGNVNAKNRSGMTPLVEASKHRRFDVAKVLLENGADPNLSASDWAPLPWVIDSGDETSVRLFLEHGADPNALSNNGESNMVYAAGKPYVKIIQALIERGGNANAQSRSGMTALVKASKQQHFEVAKALLTSGADPNLSASDWAPLPWVVDTGDENAVRLFLEHGADPNASSKNGEVNIVYAAAKPHARIVKLMIDHGGEPNKKNTSGRSPLEAAFRASQIEVIKVLLANGADTKATPGILETAVAYNNIEIVRLLLANPNTDVNEKTPAGHGAVTTAVRDNHVDILRELLSRRPDLNMETRDGLPLVRAANSDDITKLQMLVNAGADINKAESDGSTAIMQACHHGRLSHVQLLQQHGADIDLTNKSGDTALDIAAKRGHEEVVLAILEAMG